MKRLTERNKDGKGTFYPYCFPIDTCGDDGYLDPECKFMDEICEWLAKYEDIWLTPKQIRKIKKQMKE